MSEEKPLSELVARSRRIGSDKNLVLFGGGNTSSKGEITDHLGRKRRVMWIKGSGANLELAGPGDYPALYLDELEPLSKFQNLDDDEMVALVSRALVDPASRRPSIETLLHAFLPATHIDHVHADAICTLTNHAQGREAVREALGEGFAYVEWIRPGFQLSKLVAGLKDSEGVVLAHHGLVVWDDDSEKCFQKTLDAVARAENYLAAREKKSSPVSPPCEMEDTKLRALLLLLRGKLGKKQILKVDSRLAEISRRADLEAIVAAGSSTADHMLHIRPKSLALDPADPAACIDRYRQDYQHYFERQRHLLPEGFSSHGNDPKVMIHPGIGAITAAATVKDNATLAEISFHTHSVAARVRDCFGEGCPLPEAEIFGFDYWPMELFKLKSRPAPKRFEGHIFIVTGAASGIGRGIALHLAKLGANLVLADISASGLEEVAASISSAKGETPHLVLADQAEESGVERTIAESVSTFGGLDGAVINAGIGVAGRLEDLPLDQWKHGLETNLTSAFLMTKHAMAAMRTQGLGGSLVYIASKNAFAPGAGFGGYSVSKAGMLQLMRIAALEGGSAGIRANAINPDAVFDHSQLWTEEVRQKRAAEHGVAPAALEDFYASRNLLKAKVRSEDVAETAAFLLGVESSRTTGAVIAVDGGVAGAFPR
jgi:rhamnulose-1-phosphate aldolase/alcohol dehydrogenase